MIVSERLKAFSEVIVDGFFIVDTERTIVHFNRIFRAMFPRAIARSLIGRKCYEVMNLSICKERCIGRQCWEHGKQVRLDDVKGTVVEDSAVRHYIVSAIPIYDDNHELQGLLEVQRDISDEVALRGKYQAQAAQSEQQLAELSDVLQRRNRELLTNGRELERLRLELFRAKTDVYG